MAEIREVRNRSEMDKVIANVSETVFIKLTADWCGPCKNIEPFYQQLAQANSNEAKFYRFNIDHDPKLTRAFAKRIQEEKTHRTGVPVSENAMSIPAFFCLPPPGIKFKNLDQESYLIGSDPAKLARWIHNHLASIRKTVNLQRFGRHGGVIGHYAPQR